MAVINVMEGGLTDTGVTIAVAVDSSADVRVAVDTDDALPSPTFFGPVTPDADGYAIVPVTGLTAGTRYYWAAEHDSVIDTAFPGTFATLGAAAGERLDFAFWMATCAGQTPEFPGVGAVLDANRISNHEVFDTIRERALAEGWSFGIHGGDLTYYDLGSGTVGTGTVAEYQRMFDDVLLQPRQHELYRSLPVELFPDDHCRGPNNHDRTYANGANYESVFRQRVPSYALEESSGAVYRSWQVGRVLFIGADCRSARDPNSDPDTATKTMLGTAQKAWMDTVLSTSTAELLCWVMPSQWLGTTDDGFPAFTHERAELVELFAAPGGDPTKSWLPRMFGVSGDNHTIGIATAAGQPFGNFPWFQFAPLDSGSGSVRPWFNAGGSSGRGQYGVVSIRDYGHTIAVTGTGYRGTTPTVEHTFYAYLESTAVALDYAAGHIAAPFEPVEDDQATRNDVTAGRTGGNTARVEETDGPLNVADPPAGVGRYDTSVTVNVASDGQLESQAGWRVHLGTVDEPRYPSVRVDLAAHPELIEGMAALDVGDALTIDNPPGWLPVGRIEQLAQGFTETIGLYRLDITANCSPAAPWRTGEYDTDRYDTAGTVRPDSAGPIDETQTAVTLQTVLGPLWTTDAAEFPFDIVIGGERMTVTDIGADTGGGAQLFTVVRSVNGIVKTHPAGSAASLADPAVYAL